MTLSTSNTLSAHITHIAQGSVNTTVHLTTHFDQTFIANLPKHLDTFLQEKQLVTLYIDPNRIMLSLSKPLHISARNVLKVTVKDIQAGSVRARLLIALDSTTTFECTLNQDLFAASHLKLHQELFAVIKSNDILIGV